MCSSWPTLLPGSGGVSFDSLAPLLSAVERVGFPPSRQVPGPQHLQGRPHPHTSILFPTEGGPAIGAFELLGTGTVGEPQWKHLMLAALEHMWTWASSRPNFVDFGTQAPCP